MRKLLDLYFHGRCGSCIQEIEIISIKKNQFFYLDFLTRKTCRAKQWNSELNEELERYFFSLLWNTISAGDYLMVILRYSSSILHFQYLRKHIPRYPTTWIIIKKKKALDQLKIIKLYGVISPDQFVSAILYGQMIMVSIYQSCGSCFKACKWSNPEEFYNKIISATVDMQSGCQGPPRCTRINRVFVLQIESSHGYGLGKKLSLIRVS